MIVPKIIKFYRFIHLYYDYTVITSCSSFAIVIRTRPMFSRSLMVSVCLSALGTTSIHFIEPGVKVNGQYYPNIVLMQKLLPDIPQLSDFHVFQQDSTPAHMWDNWAADNGDTSTSSFYALATKQSGFKSRRPVWSVMQEKVYKKRIKDTGELRARILTAWDEMDQRIIDAEIKHWRTAHFVTRACIKAKGRTLWTHTESVMFWRT